MGSFFKQGGGLVSVHNGHIEIHDDDVYLRMLLVAVYSFLAIPRVDEFTSSFESNVLSSK
jgi:hypothetical protein